MTDVGLETIAQRFRFARERRGLGSRELGRLAGVTESFPSLIEAGVRKRFDATVLAKLAHTLGVSLDWLVNGGPTPEIDPWPREPKTPTEAAVESAPTFPDAADSPEDGESARVVVTSDAIAGPRVVAMKDGE